MPNPMWCKFMIGIDIQSTKKGVHKRETFLVFRHKDRISVGVRLENIASQRGIWCYYMFLTQDFLESVHRCFLAWQTTMLWI